MRDNSLYKVTIRCDSDSIWVREEIFVGSLTEFVERFGLRKVNPLTPFRRNGKIYSYHITEFQDGFWHSSSDPRKD